MPPDGQESGSPLQAEVNAILAAAAPKAKPSTLKAYLRRYEGSFSQAEALTVFGPDATPYAIRRRLRCSACAEVGHVEVWI